MPSTKAYNIFMRLQFCIFYIVFSYSLVGCKCKILKTTNVPYIFGWAGCKDEYQGFVIIVNMLILLVEIIILLVLLPVIIATTITKYKLPTLLSLRYLRVFLLDIVRHTIAFELLSRQPVETVNSICHIRISECYSSFSTSKGALKKPYSRASDTEQLLRMPSTPACYVARLSSVIFSSLWPACCALVPKMRSTRQCWQGSKQNMLLLKL